MGFPHMAMRHRPAFVISSDAASANRASTHDSRNCSQAAAKIAKRPLHISITSVLQACKLHGEYKMKMSVTKMALAASIALAVLAATDAAYAQPPRHRALQAYDAQANPRYGFGPRVTVGPNDVIAGHSVVGRDPDPSIRNELLREYDSGRTE